MSTVEEIKSAIETLPEREYRSLRQWLSEKDWQTWDVELERDAAAEKLDFLIDEALNTKADGKLRDL
ncbi:MAG: hypothetical protein ABI623_12960 [bacterium]